ncbi:amino acid transporter [Phellopilus nigrolimitatus]|nr:amino acid transporter [Phellopilus nigrolimitatus]
MSANNEQLEESSAPTLYEREPLLGAQRRQSAPYGRDATAKDSVNGAAWNPGDGDGTLVSFYEEDSVETFWLAATSGESFDNVPQDKRQLGLVSAVFLIFNRVIGTGIYATPSLILQSSGSIGMSLVMWLLGATIAAAGTAVFIELGTGLPRSGGEKNYLEFIFRRPKFLASCVYAIIAVLIGWAAAGAVVFGEYVVHALAIPVTPTNTRLVGALALTAAFLLHSTHLKWGLRLQNALGFFILLVMVFIVLMGVLVLALPGLAPVGRTDNLEWSKMWAGTRFEANAFVTALYSVSWSFVGYSNANYALSEVRDPVRTIKRAAPLAMLCVTLVYILVNISYFAVVSKEDILDGGRIVAALFFRNLFGPQTERIVSMIIALSVFGNMMAVQFTQGRVIQELGREGILPYSSWFASNKPYNAPFAGMFAQWVVCVITATVPPPGDAFTFILQLSSYPLVLTNIAISAGLLFLHTRRARARGWTWAPPFRAWGAATAAFLVANIFLAVVPLVPPAPGSAVYAHLPYYLHVVVSLGIAVLGAVYWYVWCVYLPRKKGYALVREFVIQEDGVSRNVFMKVPVE